MNFETISLRDVVPAKKLISVKPSQNVEEVLDILTTNNITSVPVMSEDGLMVLGFLDVLDLVAFLVQTCIKSLTLTATGESRSLTTDNMMMIHKRTKDFKLKQVTDIIDLSKRNPFHSFSEDTKLSKVIEAFQSGVHRVAVTNATNRSQLTGIFSQSDLIQLVSKDINKFKLDQEVSRMVNKSSNVVVAPADAPTIEVFMLMHQQNVSSVGIVNHEGSLLGALSASDIKFKVEKDLRELLSPVQQYLNVVHVEKRHPANFLVSVKPTAKVSELIQSLCKEHIHRVFVVDENNKPLHVVSLTDLAREIQQTKAPTSF